MGHHTIIGEALSRRAASDIGDGLILWKRDVPGEQPLMLVLEPSRLAPMEGELQLTFRHLSDLHVLTFSFAPGHVFNCARNNVLFIGGIQGLRGCRDEIRAASKRNGEIAPVAMLLLGVQAIAKAIGLRMVAVGESDQISTSYSASMIRFNYDAFWAQVGGSHVEHFYFVPLDPPQRDLSTIQLTHRSRTRRKRREKKAIRESIEASVKQLLTRSDPSNRLRSPAHRQRRGAEGPMKTERQLWASYCTPA